MEFEFILYVADQKRAAAFYTAILEREPSLDVPGMTEFTLGDKLKLGLMPENGIAKIIAHKMPHPASGNGIPRSELYLRVDDVQGAYDRALKAGATAVDPVADRDWGDRVGYVADADGHIVAFARRL
jgi:uncharacterized glyoxalase superfamily protein PhnB